MRRWLAMQQRRGRQVIAVVAQGLSIAAALVVLLWVKSYIASDTICWDRDASRDEQDWRTQWAVQSRSGVIVIGRYFYAPGLFSTWREGPMSSEAQGTILYRAGAMPLDWIGPEGTIWGKAGFEYRHTYRNMWPRNELTIISLPHPAIALPLLIWPAMRFKRMRRERKRWREGLCMRCGYDLRGISSDRCPECGVNVNGAERTERE